MKMKINKNQALYKALPYCWTTYSDADKSDYKYACQVIAWNTKKVYGVNEDMIKSDISRRAASFQVAGGVVKEEFSIDAVRNFEFVEPSLNEGIPDIICSINPHTYYCQQCNTVTYRLKSTSAPFCPNCKSNGKSIKMNQLHMVYACKCGFAEGVKPNAGENLFYKSREKENQFKFFTANNKKREMEQICPVCGKRLFPKNAMDSRLFYSQSGNLVNLYNQKYSDLIKKYHFDAEILILAKWFNIIDNMLFLTIIDSPSEYFEYKLIDINAPHIIQMAKAFGKSPKEVVEILQSTENNKVTIGSIKDSLNKLFPITILGDKIHLIISDLLEYDILRYPKSVITLEAAIEKGKRVGSIIDENDIFEIIEKLKIDQIQVSEAVQIVNYAYGFTRLRNCPDGTSETTDLRLRGFNNKVFTSILETEGILIEIDLLKVFEWLQYNEFVTNDLQISNKEEAKKWFIENINLDTITHYSTISSIGNNRITKIVYSLLHTISHMMIISAGRHSGLSHDSISELIFPHACAIFIFPTSSEGVTLGSVSGMFESNLGSFLHDALKENEICTFDPICSTHQNGACVACGYLSEVNCAHFNKDLSRSYLYGGTVKINEEEIKVKKGFWK